MRANQTPLEDYALLSDCHSAALVSRSGSVDWLCLPRFDSPAVFSGLLDREAGHWSIRPSEEAVVSRKYIDGSLVLETRFETPDGVMVLVDAFALGKDNEGHDLGKEVPHALLRQVRCESGNVRVEVEYAPRPEYGINRPLLTAGKKGVSLQGGALALHLYTRVDFTVQDGRASASFELSSGESVEFALQYQTTWQKPAKKWNRKRIRKRIDSTLHAWRTWAEMHQSYDGPWADMVHHSGRVLQGLTFFPTGAMVAAPTTSLPEVVGEDRNWDYRYCWIRDASFTLEALWVAACPDESHKFFRFMTDAALPAVRAGSDLQIAFGVGGENDLSERSLDHLAGWFSSQPVRVGNAAWKQRQVDVYGELLGAAARLREQLTEISEGTREFLIGVADGAAERWTEKDHGIWELRSEPQHYVYSKLMCWVALQRATELEKLLEPGAERLERWAHTAAEIKATLLERGWNERLGSFTQIYEGDVFDASNLVMPIVGFLDANDPRMVSTVQATRERLMSPHGLVRRHSGQYSEKEGAFLLCTFWLAEVEALSGDVERATQTFENALRFANDVGLLSEEVEGEPGRLIGNFPQAFSHIGLVNAAWAISQAGRGRSGAAGPSSRP